jgi:molybdate transport system substrate-binding protein
MMNSLITAALVAIAAVVPTVSASAQSHGSVAVAAASDLQTVFPQLAAAFERVSGIKPAVTFGSSGNFFAQIQNGAPFDVFFSADADYPRRLAASAQADPDSVYEYATGRLVLWTRIDSGVDVGKGMEILRSDRVRRIAIANPAVAPYGRAAVAALASEHLFPALEKKLVYAENLAQAAQLAESGNADVALIGHALALGTALKTAGRFFEIPARNYPPVVQAVAIVSASKNKDNARALVEYLKSAEARTILQAFGFEVPAGPR